MKTAPSSESKGS